MKLRLLMGLSHFLWALLDSRRNWLVWASLFCFVMAVFNGLASYFALRHNVPLNGVVEFFGPGNRSQRGSDPLEYLSALIIYSLLGFFGGIFFALVWRTQNRFAAVR